MNLQTWAKWVAEIDAMTGGAIVELRPGPYGIMKIGVRWMIGNKRYWYEHAMSLSEMERMVEAAQPCVLEKITHVVRRMTPHDVLYHAPRKRTSDAITITREQLEKAAKAAGIEIYWQRFYAADGPTAYLGGIKWEPLVDRGQLLDLAMACKICIDPRFNLITYRTVQAAFVCESVNCQDFPALAEAVILAACEQFDAKGGA